MMTNKECFKIRKSFYRSLFNLEELDQKDYDLLYPQAKSDKWTTIINFFPVTEIAIKLDENGYLMISDEKDVPDEEFEYYSIFTGEKTEWEDIDI
ncbi:hypothetical protein [Bulleidia sp. zg-1006]|uniref:hypothetical protein n=1 Tax=Bulleidia sp. zg-1006 TaxID=2806552 RepID=UPI00193AD46A|nr:hypothetical protein [Bulleidia sp. zg-1006]QRG86069.1 hypothetical protein JOS54_04130 [Bulleidia sp. zg-1006]